MTEKTQKQRFMELFRAGVNFLDARAQVGCTKDESYEWAEEENERYEQEEIRLALLADQTFEKALIKLESLLEAKNELVQLGAARRLLEFKTSQVKRTDKQGREIRAQKQRTPSKWRFDK